MLLKFDELLLELFSMNQNFRRLGQLPVCVSHYLPHLFETMFAARKMQLRQWQLIIYGKLKKAVKSFVLSMFNESISYIRSNNLTWPYINVSLAIYRPLIISVRQ